MLFPDADSSKTLSSLREHLSNSLSSNIDHLITLAYKPKGNIWLSNRHICNGQQYIDASEKKKKLCCKDHPGPTRQHSFSCVNNENCAFDE